MQPSENIIFIDHIPSHINIDADSPEEPIDLIPDEIIFQIFSQLTVSELQCMHVVSKRWGRIAADHRLWNAALLKKSFSTLHIIDKSVWKSLDIDVEDEPAIDKPTVYALQKFIQSVKVEGHLGVTLLTMPINLTMNLLHSLTNNSNINNKVDFTNDWKWISNRAGDEAVCDTHLVAVTRSILEDSKDKTCSAQQAQLSSMGYKLPNLLTITTLMALTYINSPLENPIRLYAGGAQDDEIVCTRCSDVIDERNAIVGNFNDKGIDMTVTDENDTFEFLGAAAMLKFTPPEARVMSADNEGLKAYKLQNFCAANLLKFKKSGR